MPRKVESMLHTILDNCRLDGEYFWDGNETLVDAVSDFMSAYHPEADEIGVIDEADVAAAAESVSKKNSQRIYTEVIPELDRLSIDYALFKNGKGVRIKLPEYNLSLSGRTGGRYTLTIWSKTKSTEEALEDFSGSQELSANGSEDSNRRARIPMSPLPEILESISGYLSREIA